MSSDDGLAAPLALLRRLCACFACAHVADLPASPAGLLGRFAPSGFALCARILLALLAHVLRFALTKHESSSNVQA